MLHVVVTASAALFASTALAGIELEVQSVEPAAGSILATGNTDISITFDKAIDPASVTPRSFHAFSRGAGSLQGTLSLSPDGRTLTLDPAITASPGEPVTVTLANTI